MARIGPHDRQIRVDLLLTVAELPDSHLSILCARDEFGSLGVGMPEDSRDARLVSRPLLRTARSRRGEAMRHHATASHAVHHDALVGTARRDLHARRRVGHVENRQLVRHLPAGGGPSLRLAVEAERIERPDAQLHAASRYSRQMLLTRVHVERAELVLIFIAAGWNATEKTAARQVKERNILKRAAPAAAAAAAEGVAEAASVSERH